MKLIGNSFILVLTVLMLGFATGSFAQSTGNYAFTFASNGSLIDMSTGTTGMLAAATYHDDVASSVTNIGFTFTFMGVNYTQFSINSNGQLRLGATVISGTAASPAAGVPLIAPMGGDNAILAAGRVHFRVDGSAPTRNLIVQWDSLRIPFASASAGSVVQAILSESGGVIQFRYGLVYNNTAATARTIFFSSSNLINTVGSVTVGATPTYSTAATPTSNTFSAVGAVPNLSSTADGSRWVYTFTPPVGSVAAPISLTFTSVGRTGMTVNWVDNSTNEAFFTVSRATSAGGPYTIVATVASTTSPGTGTAYSSIQSGLSPGTTYFFRIAAAHEGAASSDLSGSQATDVLAPFSGAYTINPDAPNTGTNFTTFGEAFSGLNAVGLTGPTTFTVTGTASTITFSEGNLTLGGTGTLLLTTLNATNTLTFVAGSGKTINMSGVGTGAADFVFRLAGVDYVTFDGINIVDVGTTNTTWFEFGYVLQNASTNDGATNNTIKNMAITLNKANTSITNGPYGVAVGNGTTIITFGTAGTYASRNNFNKIQNFTISGIKRGIQFDGLALPAFDEGNEISGPAFTSAAGGTWLGGSRITNFGGATSGTDYGIGIDGQKNMKVFNVQIDGGSATTAGTAMSGIHFGTAASTSDGADNVEVYNCVVRNIDNTAATPTAGVAGIRATATTQHTVKIYNTAVYDLRNLGSGTGNLLMAFQFNGPGAASKIELYNNSVNISSVHTNVAGQARGLLTSSASLYIVAKNNVFQVTGGGSTGGARAIELGGPPTLVELSNNIYNVGTTSPSRVVGVHGTTLRQNLIDWQSTMATPSDGLDQGSGYGDPGFNSATDLTYGVANRVNNSGVPISGLSTNAGILGVIRSTTTPDLGAFEGDFSAGFVDASVPGIYIAPLDGSIAAEIPVTIRDNVETGANLNARLWYRLGTSGAFSVLPPDVTPASATNGTYRWSTSLRALAAGTYQYYIVVRDAAGNSFATPTMTPGATSPGFTVAGDAAWDGANPFASAGVRTFQNLGTTLAAGTYPVGTGEFYTNLAAVAAEISAKPIAGNVIFELTNNYDADTNLTAPIVFNQPSYVGTGTFTITIRPAASVTTERVTQGNPGSGNALIVLDGARRVILDGRPGGAGTSRSWRITNTRSAATIGEAIRFVNDAISNTIQYVVAEGNSQTVTTGSVIYIAGTYYGGQGNNNNVIDNCIIRNYAAGTSTPPNPAAGIVCLGGTEYNKNITISNNQIYNFHSITTNPRGMYIDGTVGGTVTGNHIYQTAVRSGIGALSQGILVGGGTGPGFTVTGNFIGGSAPNCGGAPYTITSASGMYVIDLFFGSSTTSSTVANNTVANINITTNPTASAILFVGLGLRGGNQFPIIADNNTIGNSLVDATVNPSIAITTGTAFTSTAIGIFASSGLNTITNNTIGGFMATVSGAGIATQFVGIQHQTAALTALLSGNLIGSLTTANNIVNTTPTYAAGIRLLTGGNIVGNTIANITTTSTTATVGTRGIEVTAGPAIIRNNVVRNVTGGNVSTWTDYDAAVQGIECRSTAADILIEGNTVHTLIASNTGTTNTCAQGIRVTSGTGRVLRNNIYNLVNNSTGAAPLVYGLHVAGGTWTVANNMIAAGSGLSNNLIVNGLRDAGTGIDKYYYNSVNVSGTVSTGVNNSYAFVRTSTAVDTLRNNIFANFRAGGTGSHFAIGTGTSGWGTGTSNFNILYSASPSTVGDWGTTALTFAGWQAAQPGGSGGDANTLVGDPGFLSTSDLHISPGSAIPSNNGTPLVGIVDVDYDGQPRSATTPDRGADEYTALPPVTFALVSPANSATNVPTNGTLIWGSAQYAFAYDVYMDTSASPTTLISANQTDTTFAYIALNPFQLYRWRVVAKNGVGNTNPTVSPFSFTTAAQPPETPDSLVISAVTSDSLDLAWRDNATNEEGYRVLRSLAVGGPFAVISGDLPLIAGSGGTGTYRDRPLIPNTRYYYRIVAFNTIQGNSNPLSGDTTTLARTPGQPVLSSVLYTTMRVTLAASDGNPAGTQYAIRVSYPTSIVKFLQTDGTLGDTIRWQTYAQWGGVSGRAVSWLTMGTTYTFDANARNGNSIETPFSLSAATTTLNPITAFPYTNNFEGATDEGWSTGIVSGTANDWVRGTPAKAQLNGARSGVKAWVTGLTGTYQISQNSFVMSPLLDFSGQTSPPVLSFWHNFKVELNWEGMIVEYSTDGGTGWTKLGVLNDTTALNWYNNTSTSGPMVPPKWSGNSNVFGVGYVLSAIKLTPLIGQGNSRLRFRFASDASVNDEGWAIDDVTILPGMAVNYTMMALSQLNAVPTPFRPAITEEPKGGNVAQLDPSGLPAVPASQVNNSVLLDNFVPVVAGERLRVTTAESGFGENTEALTSSLPISMRTIVSNIFGTTSPAYQVAWSVGGLVQTPVSRPGIAVGARDTAILTAAPISRGTLTTIANAVVSGDGDTTDNVRSFVRTLVYPDPMVRVRYDNGLHTPDVYVGYNNPAIAITGGVRFTAPQAMKLANIDAFYRNEGNIDSIEVRVWAAGSDTLAPGVVLYSRKFAGVNYNIQGAVGDYFTLPLGTDAPTFAAGSDYWVSITYSPLVPFPMGVHNTGFTAGRSFYSGDGGLTWTRLIITTERAWILRSVGMPATPAQPPGVSAVARSVRVPLAGDSVVVTANILDSANVGIASGLLLVNVNGTLTTTVPMTRTSGTPISGAYRAVIPGSVNANGNRVEYQIRAVSFSGSSTTTAVIATNSYFAGISPLTLTGLRTMDASRRILYTSYYARVSGTVNGPNFQTTNLGYHFQDAFGGINLFRSGGTTPVLNLGDSIIVLGRVGQFRGLTQITPDTVTVDIQIVATGRPLPVIDLTVAQFQADAENYESRLIRLTTIYRRDATPAWPPLGTAANIIMYQTTVTDTVIMRIDSDTEIDGTPEPLYPIQTAGVAGQFTSVATLYNDGYQIQPRYLTDFKNTVIGSYNVGAAHRITTLRRAFSFLSDTTSFLVGPATFLLTDAAYTDSLVDVAVFNGSSPTNSVTIRPASGNNPVVTLRGNATLSVGIRFSTISNFTLDGSNSATPARNMTVLIDTTSPTSTTGIFIRGTARNFILKNFRLFGYRTSLGAATAILIDSLGTQASDSNLVMSNLEIRRAFNGIFFNSRASRPPHKDVFIENCLVGGTGVNSIIQVGMSVGGVDRAIIRNNEINGVNTTGFTANAFGLNMAPNAALGINTNTNYQIYNNKITNIVQAGATTGVGIGIQAAGQTGVPSRYKIWNNMIWDIQAPVSTNTGSFGGPLQGISLPGAVGDSLYFNSVWIGGTSTANNHSSALYMVAPTTAETTKTVVLNNILLNTSTMGTTARNPVVKYFDASGASYSLADRNDYYFIGRGATAAVGALSLTPIFITPLDSFKLRTGRDANSIAIDPRFDMANLLHIRTDRATPVESFGLPIAGITTDFDGDLRNATTPDIGADEGVFIPFTLGTISGTFDSVAARVNLSWTMPPGMVLAENAVSGNDKTFLPDRVDIAPAIAGELVAGTNGQPDLDRNLLKFGADRRVNSDVVPIPYGSSDLAAPLLGVVELVQQALMPARLSFGTSEDIGSRTTSESATDEQAMAEPALLHSSAPSLDWSPRGVEIGDPIVPTVLQRYLIYRSVAGGAFSLIDSAAATATSYTDARVDARPYRYFLRARFDDGLSGPTDTASVTVRFIRAEVEPNGTATTANWMTLGYQIAANLTSGDLDWYRFMSAPGHLVADGFDPGNLTDVVIQLYDSSGTRLLYEVDRNINDRLEYDLAYNGAYYIRISPYTTSTGPYTLFARIAPGTDPREPDDGPMMGFPNIATFFTGPTYLDSLATINPGVGLPGFDLDYRMFTRAVGGPMTATLRTRSRFPASSMNGGYVGIGRKNASATLLPQLFGGTPLASGFSTTGANVTVAFTAAVADTYYVFVSVHLQSPAPYGWDQAGPNARYEISIDLITDVGAVSEIPTVYSLEQNYPNPFNPTTQIKYALPKSSVVRLIIYNLLGQEVVKLVDAEQTAGYHEIAWDGRNGEGQTLSSGLYFYRIEAAPSDGGATFVDVKKMMLVK